MNNAGFYIPGDVELSTIEQYKKCADVNLYGMIRVIKGIPTYDQSIARYVYILDMAILIYKRIFLCILRPDLAAMQSKPRLCHVVDRT